MVLPVEFEVVTIVRFDVRKTCFQNYFCVKRHTQLLLITIHDTDKPTVLRISWKPQIKLHNNVILMNSREWYEGRSINKLQNGAIPSILKIGKIRNIRFVGNLILNINTTFLDDDVIIVTSSDNRTQSIYVLFSPSVYYRNSQVVNSIRVTEKNEKA